jgi:biotin operon repressor
MNIQHLKYAVKVGKTGSITQVADNLYMGQPNLSKAIRELKSSMGIAIFKRTGKGVVPTKKGQEFLGYARSILSQIEEMESLYKSEKANKQRFCLVQRKCEAEHRQSKDLLIYPKGYRLSKLEMAFMAKIKAVRDELERGEYW